MNNKPTKMSELVPSKYLEAIQFDPERTLTIKDWAIELVGRDQEPMGVLYFQETDRGLVINKRKKKALTTCFGDDLAEYVGKQITLFATETTYMGEIVPAIGIRIKK